MDLIKGSTEKTLSYLNMLALDMTSVIFTVTITRQTSRLFHLSYKVK